MFNPIEVYQASETPFSKAAKSITGNDILTKTAAKQLHETNQ